MTLQRRLLVLLLVAVPVIWVVAVVSSLLNARHEINELFDTQQVRLAQQVLSLVQARAAASEAAWPEMPVPSQDAGNGDVGEAELKDVSVAVWSADGRLRLADREGHALPRRSGPSGFADLMLDGEPWRVYYLREENGGWTVAVGQASEERDEVLQGLLIGQLLPWVLMLPVLLAAMAMAVRYALKPVRALARDIGRRGPDELHAIGVEDLPAEVQPLVRATNRLFDKIRSTLEHERRLTADAAHELRTPLAALRSQWEAMRVADEPGVRDAAFRQVGAGIQRLERVVTQLLALSGVESRPEDVFATPVDWRHVVQDALSDCLPLIESSGGEVDVEWPADDAAALPLAGDAALLTLLLRNLVDNALRYGGSAPHVTIRFTPDALVVEDDGPGVAADVLVRLGDRFYRPPGQTAPGSGLGLSIVRRVADLHGLAVQVVNREAPAHGLRVTVLRATSA